MSARRNRIRSMSQGIVLKPLASPELTAKVLRDLEEFRASSKFVVLPASAEVAWFKPRDISERGRLPHAMRKCTGAIRCG